VTNCFLHIELLRTEMNSMNSRFLFMLDDVITSALLFTVLALLD
jgi:hypothetical protein